MRLTPYIIAIWPLVTLAQQPSEVALARDQLLRDSAAEQQARERQVVDEHWMTTATHAEAVDKKLNSICDKIKDEDLKKECDAPLVLSTRRAPETREEMCAKAAPEVRAKWQWCNDPSEPKAEEKGQLKGN